MASASLKRNAFCTGRCSIAECIQYDGNLPCRVHLVPRPGSTLAPQVIAVYVLVPRTFRVHRCSHYMCAMKTLVSRCAAVCNTLWL